MTGMCAFRLKARLQNVRLIEVDVTRTTSETRALLSDFAVIGPPTMIFLNVQASEPPATRLVGEMKAGDVLASLEIARAVV